MAQYAPLGPGDDPNRERDVRELAELLRTLRPIFLQEITLTIGGDPVTKRHGVNGTPWVLLQPIGEGLNAELRAVDSTSYQVALTGSGSGERRVLAIVVDPA